MPAHARLASTSRREIDPLNEIDPFQLGHYSAILRGQRMRVYN
jgi:hypothetical protein